jgi:hypothetical protein
MANIEVNSDTLSQGLGMTNNVKVHQLPRHARQTCDVIYGHPNLVTTFVPPVVSRTYQPLPLRILCSTLVVANTPPLSLQS